MTTPPVTTCAATIRRPMISGGATDYSCTLPIGHAGQHCEDDFRWDASPRLAVVEDSQAPIEEPLTAAVRVRRWIREHITAPLKRSHWVFRVHELVLHKLQQIDRQQEWQGGTTKALNMYAVQNQELAKLVRALNQRLIHHEQGPLKESREEWNRWLADGVLPMSKKPAAPEPRRQASKRFDVTSGKVEETTPGAEPA